MYDTKVYSKTRKFRIIGTKKNSSVDDVTSYKKIVFESNKYKIFKEKDYNPDLEC